MDPQFENWQQAFQQATPAIDIDKLLSQVKQLKRKQQVKAYADLLGGIAVSLYCIYAALWLASSIGQTWLFAALAPIPVIFGIWSFRLRHQHWQQQTLDVHALLAFKREQLLLQLKYWRVSVWGIALLYLVLLGLALINYSLNATMTIWLVQLAVNGVLLLLVSWRYQYLKRRLIPSLHDIDVMAGE
jgi:hypothetical protein